MTKVSLRVMGEADLPFVSEVRNHQETLKFLHDQRQFSVEQTREWFRKERPEWLIIHHGDDRVGYIRTSNRDIQNLSLKVGADVHPNHRRRGYARSAYQELFKRLIREGWVRVWLEVLPTNIAAISLYEKVGFQFEGRLVGAAKAGTTRQDSIVMGRILCPTTQRNAKVIAVYLGPRRSHPSNSAASYDMLGFLLDQELALDPGCSCDTLLVYNRCSSDSEISKDAWTLRSEELLGAVDGEPTPGGQLRLLTRENVGISFGAFNHAFENYFEEYDYWLFTEDDQILIKSGCFGKGIEQMKNDSRVGFVAIVGVSVDRSHPSHAHGGVGISSRSVLREVMRNNGSEHHMYGHLPYHWESGYSQQEHLGEIRFTNAIHKLGYRLIEHEMESICVSWGHKSSRSPRMVEWSTDMAVNHRFNVRNVAH